MFRPTPPLSRRLRGFLFRSLGLVFVAVVFASTSHAQSPAAISLTTARWGHTATALPGDRVFVAGGANQNGALGSTEMLDFSTLHAAVGPALLTPRTDHTATLLGNGLVFIAGGSGASGPLATTELFDPASGTIAPGPAMTVPRSGHTATMLPDGRVLVTGGDAGGTAEIYTPGRGFEATGSLAVARSGHAAALFADGSVMVAGGTDAAGSALNSVEMFNAGAFTVVPGTMLAPRVRPTLNVLPDGKVQIIGGDTAFSIEMFDPDFSQFKALASLPPLAGLIDPTLATQNRYALLTAAIGLNANVPASYAWALQRDRFATVGVGAQLLVVGGTNGGQALGSGALFPMSAATVMTDFLDYNPGSPVAITGTGWTPGETVTLFIHQEPQMRPDTTLTAVADGTGAIKNWEFMILDSDVNTVFTVTAGGSASGSSAQTAFSDAAPAKILFATAGLPTGASVSVAYSGSNNGGNPISGTVTLTSPGPSGVLSVDSTSLLHFTFAASVTVAGSTYNFDSASPASPFTTGVSGSTATVTATYKPATVTPTFSNLAPSSTISYGTGSITVSGTIGAGTSYPPTTESVTVTINGVALSVPIGANGAFSSSFDTHAIPASTTAYTITYAYAGDAGFNAASNTSTTLTVNKATASVVITPYSVTYDGQPHTATVASINGVNGETGATVGTVDVSHTTHTNAGTYATDYWTFTGTANYNNIGQTTITDTINKATATVVVAPYTVTYDGAAHTAAVTSITGVNGETGATVGTVDLSHTTHTNAGTYATDYWTFSGGTNYNDIGQTTITDTINKATATVVVTPYSVTYDGAAHTAAVTSITGVNGETGATVGAVDVSHTTHTNAGTYAADYWTFTGTANYNNVGQTTITDTINKAPLTVTADNKTMVLNGALPTLTFSITGFVLTETAAVLTAVPSCTTTATGTQPGAFPITCSGGSAANYAFTTYTPGTLTVQYATGGACLGDAGHSILQPINVDGSSVFKQTSTTPAKFRVCDANGASVGTPGVVSAFKLVQIVTGTSSNPVDQTVTSTTPDAFFRWDSTAQQWIFNISNKPLAAGNTYVFLITLNDNSTIQFAYGLK